MSFSNQSAIRYSGTVQGFELSDRTPPQGASQDFSARARKERPSFFGFLNDQLSRESRDALAHRGNASILQLDGISLAFGGVRAITHVNLEIGRGEIRAIIGPNGAGKSSIINVISGIYRPEEGKVWIDGKAYNRVPSERLARLGIARTFQNLALFSGLTVLENVALGLSAQLRAGVVEQLLGLGLAGREKNKATAQSLEILDFLGLSDLRNRSIDTLSYGFQKRVELARALVGHPKILLLDEPMAGMTAADKQDMVRLVRAARDEFGTTVVLIEHDLGVVMGISDRIAVFDQGRKIADGSPSEVRNDQSVIDAYIGVVHEDEEEVAHV